MGNSSSIYQPFYTGRNLANGNLTLQRNGLYYSGLFEDGWMSQGKIMRKIAENEYEIIAEGKFKLNYLESGINEESFKKIANRYVPNEVRHLLEDEHYNNHTVYVTGQYYIDNNELDLPELHGKCSIYYNKEHTLKFMEAEFDEGEMIRGTIYRSCSDNNLVITAGEFEKTDFGEYHIKSGVFAKKVEIDNLFNEILYQKVEKDLFNKNATFENNLTGYAEFYADNYARNLKIKCSMQDGKIKGDTICFNNDIVLFDGIIECCELIKGLLYYRGFYVDGEFSNSELQGLGTLYYDRDCKNKYAEVNFENGEYHGLMTIYDNNKQIVKYIVYSNGEPVDSKQPETNNSFTILKETDNKTSENKYERFYSLYNDEKKSFVYEHNLIEALDKIKTLQKRNLSDMFMLWFEDRLIEKDWLTTLNQTENTYFHEYVGEEIEELFELANEISKKSNEKYAVRVSHKRHFANTLYDILNQPTEYETNPDFANTLLADIYSEFLQFCTISLHCQLMNNTEFYVVTKQYIDYIKDFEKSKNSYVDRTKTKTPKYITPLKSWLADKLSNNYDMVKEIVTPYLFNIIHSRCERLSKNNNEFAEELINQLKNPLHTDIRNNRAKEMQEALEALQCAYDESIEQNN